MDFFSSLRSCSYSRFRVKPNLPRINLESPAFEKTGISPLEDAVTNELGQPYQNEVDKYIGLDFLQVKTRKEADFIILGVCEKNTILDGIVTTSLDGTKAIMTLNGCNTPFSSKHPPETLFLHELGHVLGLDHPFDNSDGDCIGSTDPWSSRSAHTGHTLMAYRDPPGNVRTFFTELDILALQEIWGRD